MAEKFPKRHLGQEAQRFPIQINPKRAKPRNIIIKM